MNTRQINRSLDAINLISNGGLFMLMRRWILVGIVVLMLIFIGCGTPTVFINEEYPLTTTVRVIDLTGYNGAINWLPLRPYERPRIEILKKVSGTDIEAMHQFIEKICIEDYGTNSAVVLHAVQPRKEQGIISSSVQFIVYASPDWIREFYAQTSNGSINIEAAFKGYLSLRTSNGRIRIFAGEGEVDVQTSNGRIELGKVRLTDSSTLRTTNGRIGGKVALPAFGRFLFESTNGSINLEMPYSTTGVFELKTSNGNIRFSLGQIYVNKKGHAFVDLGSHSIVEIKTTNGSISVSPIGEDEFFK